MKRRVLNFLTALSLLLSVAAAGLWARSYWRSDSVEGIARGRWVSCYSQWGSLDWSVDVRPTLGGPSEFKWFSSPAAEGSEDWRAHLSDFHVTREGEGDTAYGRVPHWSLLIVGLALPAVRFIQNRRGVRRSRKGACPRCGYDLRATPDRCPECGAAASVTTSG
jgi:hypothetical protein